MMGEQKSERELFSYAVNLEKRVRPIDATPFSLPLDATPPLPSQSTLMSITRVDIIRAVSLSSSPASVHAEA